MKRRLTLLAAVVFVVLFVAGCSVQAPSADFNTQTSTSVSGSDERPVIGVSFGQAVHPHFVAERQGILDAAEKLGVDIVFRAADYDMQKQVSDIENMAQQGVDAIIECPIDSEALAPVTEEIMKKGIGVITVDIGVVGTEVDSYVSSDNYGIGVIAADYIVQQIGEKGKIAVIGWPTVLPCKQREIGFQETMKEKYPDIEIVAYQEGGMDRTIALPVAENIIQAHPDLDAIFGSNESSAMGAMGAADSAKMDILIVGVDATPDLLNAIKNGTKIKATVGQNPYKMGYTACEAAMKLINKDPSLQKQYITEVGLITINNVDAVIEEQEALY